MTRRSRRSVAVLAVLIAVFVGGFVVGPQLGVGVPPEAVALVVVALAVLAALYGFRRASSGKSVWDAIPRWQYTGRHVESGGLTRDGQEQALRDVEEEAERRSER